MTSKSAEKSRALAKYLKSRGIERTTSQCPWGCGHTILNGGDALISHLRVCKGSGKKVRRT